MIGMVAFMLLFLALHPLCAQVTTEVLWQRCIGGSGFDDPGPGFTRTTDGGFVVIGWSDSNDGDVPDNHGNLDILVSKLGANGSVQWSRALGGSEAEFGVSCIEASDGSIYVMGNTGSTDGDVTGTQGIQDTWVVKLSAQGTLLWQRTYGGSGSENSILHLRQTPDGGFMFHGLTTSVDGDVTDLNGPGEQDHWIVKLDAAGDIEWNRTLGGSEAEYGINVLPTPDGGYVVNFAYIRSNDGDVVNNHGEDDCWLVKLNATGAIVWSLTIGGSDQDQGMDAVVLPDGDIAVLGHTKSTDGDIQENHGNYDVFIAKVSSGGTLLWTRTYGGSQNETASELLTTAEGGFLVMASSNSNDGDVTGAHGGQDIVAGAVQDAAHRVDAISDQAFAQRLDDRDTAGGGSLEFEREIFGFRIHCEPCAMLCQQSLVARHDMLAVGNRCFNKGACRTFITADQFDDDISFAFGERQRIIGPGQRLGVEATVFLGVTRTDGHDAQLLPGTRRQFLATSLQCFYDPAPDGAEAGNGDPQFLCHFAASMAVLFTRALRNFFTLRAA